MALTVKTQSIPTFSDSSTVDPLAGVSKRLPATKALIAARPCPPPPVGQLSQKSLVGDPFPYHHPLEDLQDEKLVGHIPVKFSPSRIGYHPIQLQWVPY